MFPGAELGSFQQPPSVFVVFIVVVTEMTSSPALLFCGHPLGFLGYESVELETPAGLQAITDEQMDETGVID